MPNGSRRLVLPAPSAGFAVAGAPLEVFPSCIPSARAQETRPPSIGLACSEPPVCRRSRRIVSSRESACVAPPPSNDAASTPRHPRVSFGVLVPPSPSCSAPVVSHHLGGLLRSFACESVSPRSGHGVHDLAGVPQRPPPKRQGQADLSSRARTLRSMSPPAAAPCHHGRCHPDVAPGESWRRLSVGPAAHPCLHREARTHRGGPPRPRRALGARRPPTSRQCCRSATATPGPRTRRARKRDLPTGPRPPPRTTGDSDQPEQSVRLRGVAPLTST
jgi:hypothetical protein